MTADLHCLSTREHQNAAWYVKYMLVNFIGAEAPLEHACAGMYAVWQAPAPHLTVNLETAMTKTNSTMTMLMLMHWGVKHSPPLIVRFMT